MWYGRQCRSAMQSGWHTTHVIILGTCEYVCLFDFLSIPYILSPVFHIKYYIFCMVYNDISACHKYDPVWVQQGQAWSQTQNLRIPAPAALHWPVLSEDTALLNICLIWFNMIYHRFDLVFIFLNGGATLRSKQDVCIVMSSNLTDQTWAGLGWASWVHLSAAKCS